MRALILAFVALLAAAAGATFWVSYSVDRERAELARIEQAVAAEQQRIAVLRAEWAYLTRPSRVARLASERLGMGPAHANMLARIGDLPFPEPQQRPEPGTPKTAPQPPALLASAKAGETDGAAQTKQEARTAAFAPQPNRKPATPARAAQVAEAAPPPSQSEPTTPAARVQQVGYRTGVSSRLDAVLSDLAFGTGVRR